MLPFEKITGYSREEIVGHNCRFLQGQENGQEGLQTIRDAINRYAQNHSQALISYVQFQ